MKLFLQTLTLLMLAVLLYGCGSTRSSQPEDKRGINIPSVATEANRSDVSSSEPLVNIPDAVFKSYLLNEVVYNMLPYESGKSSVGVKFLDTVYVPTAQKIDANGDGEISLAEAEQVVFLKVCDLNIKDFAGLEYFPNLTGLVINRVGMDSPRLDLSGNARLKYLDCSRSNLTAIDFSKNGELLFLNCKNNQLATLDLSKNSNLQILYCGGNRLSLLDLSRNRKLTRLSCENNKLASLDLSNNVALEYVDCLSNELCSLDVARNVMLSSLYCDYNPLTTLYVAAGHSFKHLSLPENATITNK